jgi:hypothetical protein
MNQFNFKIRASALSKIMTKPKEKTALLSKTAESYLEQWTAEKLFNREAEIKSKYIEKGNLCEEQSIEALAKHLGVGLLLKNDRRVENNFFTGEADIVTPNFLADVKSSWDCFTFPLFETECPEIAYYYQAQVYMHLYGIEKYYLCYYLADAPHGLIESEARKESYKLGFTEMQESIFDAFEKKMTYSDIPEQHRIKIFNIEFDPSVIETAIGKHSLCVDYIKQLLSKTGLGV